MKKDKMYHQEMERITFFLTWINFLQKNSEGIKYMKYYNITTINLLKLFHAKEKITLYWKFN